MAIYIIVTILIIVLLIVIFIILRNTDMPQRAQWTVSQRQQRSWQQLADKHTLTFLPSRVLTENHLFGRYRGHHLDLEIIKKLDGEINRDSTRLTVRRGTSIAPPPPTPEKIERLLTLSHLAVTFKGQVDSHEAGQRLIYEQYGIAYDRLYLQNLLDYSVDLIQVYPHLTDGDPATITLLQSIAAYDGLTLQPFAEQALREAGIDVPADSPRALICQKCLAHYTEKGSLLPVNGASHCRVCERRQGYLAGTIVMVLDERLEESQQREGTNIQVNWFQTRTLVDFDEVAIIRASDEAVERFAVQVGNDTDPWRAKRYSHLPCLIAPDCELSGNTRRILERIFGPVEER